MGVERVHLWIVSALLLVSLAGCASPPQSLAPSGRVTSQGQAYELDGIEGSGFRADMRLARSRPITSRAGTLSVAVAVYRQGAVLDPGSDSPSGDNPPLLVVSALTPSGGIFVGQEDQMAWPIRAGEFDFGDQYPGLPSDATAVRLTLHLGKNDAAARTGTSVVVPLGGDPGAGPAGAGIHQRRAVGGTIGGGRGTG